MTNNYAKRPLPTPVSTHLSCASSAVQMHSGGDGKKNACVGVGRPRFGPNRAPFSGPRNLIGMKDYCTLSAHSSNLLYASSRSSLMTRISSIPRVSANAISSPACASRVRMLASVSVPRLLSLSSRTWRLGGAMNAQRTARCLLMSLTFFKPFMSISSISILSLPCWSRIACQLVP